MFRKPNPMLFELALKKAGLPSRDVWFCGDSIEADVEGSANAGIFPVWYDDLTVENPWAGQNDGKKPGCGHLHISAWKEFTDILDKMNGMESS